jgi:hypothetical protein
MTVGAAPAVPGPVLVSAVEEAMGQPVVTWRKPHTGLSLAQRFIATLADGSSVFVKAAVDDDTERWLRNDYLIASTLDDLVPDVVAWTQADGRAVLISEDLSDAHWPADHDRIEHGVRKPVWWRSGQLDLLVETLERLADMPAPPSLEPLEAIYEPQWLSIAEHPGMFLGLGLCDAAWFERVLPDLLSAEATLDLGGDTLVHNDVRSDNVCFRGDNVILVDWCDPRRGDPTFDLANLLQGLPMEGGPDPYDVLPDAGSFAAWRAGEFANRAVNHDSSVPEWLIDVFKRMVLIDLDWAARCLELPKRSGVDWRAI